MIFATILAFIFTLLTAVDAADSSKECTALQLQNVPKQAIDGNSANWTSNILSFPKSPWLLTSCNGEELVVDLRGCKSLNITDSKILALSDMYVRPRTQGGLREYGWKRLLTQGEDRPWLLGGDRYCAPTFSQIEHHLLEFVMQCKYDDSKWATIVVNYVDKTAEVSTCVIKTSPGLHAKSPMDAFGTSKDDASKVMVPGLSAGLERMLLRRNATAASNTTGSPSPSRCPGAPLRAFPPTAQNGSTCPSYGNGVGRTVAALGYELLIGLVVFIVMVIWDLI